MKSKINIIIGALLLFAIFILPVYVPASQQNNEALPTDTKQNHGDTEQQIPAVPNLSDIIPKVTELSGSFADLKVNLKQVPDFLTVEKQYAEIAVDVEELTSKFNQLKEEEEPNLTKVYALRRAVSDKKSLLEEVGGPLEYEIHHFDSWKEQWLSEKARWDDWESSLLKDQESEQLKQAFKKATKIIDKGLDLIAMRLGKILILQTKGGIVGERIEALEADVRAWISSSKHGYLYRKSPSMFSRDYYSQFNSEFWNMVVDDLSLISWPISRYFDRYRWAFLLQFVCFFLVFFVIYRNKKVLNESEHWKLLAERPISTTLLIVVLSAMFFWSYIPVPDFVKLTYRVVGSISTVRLLGLVIDRPWRRQAAYAVMTIFVVSELLTMINLPLEFFRLYILLVSFIVLVCLYHWARQNSTQNKKGLYAWSINAFAGLFIFISIAEIIGNDRIAHYLFIAMIKSMALVLPYILLIHIIRGALHWVFFSSLVWQVKLLRTHAEYCVQRTVYLFAAAIVGFGLLPGILVTWNLYETIPQAVKRMYSYGINIGTLRFNLGMIVASATVFYLSFLASRILPRVILDKTFTGRTLTRGVRRSVTQLIQYSLIFIGFFLAFLMFGFDFTNFTIVLSALSVGIGFGLKGVANNFVCGLILLFERPLTEGDTIDIGMCRAHIKKIGLRATIVETLDMADLIIPNADLINNQVTNWTLTNREVRISAPVSVAYGSDVSLIVEILLTCARNQKEVVKSPEPEVLFLNFGDSSIDFELRAWIKDVDFRLQVKSALYHEIERRFRESNVVIPFPQRDVHLYGLDRSGALSAKPSHSKKTVSSGDDSSKPVKNDANKY